MFGVETTILWTVALSLVCAEWVHPRARSPVTSVCSATTLPRPHRVHCNFSAHLRRPTKPFSALTAPSFETCRDRCLVKSRCISFGYTKKDHRCRLYNVTIASQHPKRTASNTAYWNRHCFKANFTTTPVLTNGGFERGNFEGWTVSLPPRSKGGSAAVHRPGYDSRHAAYLAAEMDKPRNGDSNTITLIQTFGLCGGVTYDVYGSYYVETPAQEAYEANFEPEFDVLVRQTRAKTFAVTNVYLPYGGGVSMGVWTSIPAASFTPAEDAQYLLQIDMGTRYPGSPLSMRFDNFSVVARPH